MGMCECRVEFNRPFKQGLRRGGVIAEEGVLSALEIVIVGSPAFGRLASRPFRYAATHLPDESRGDDLGHFILNSKYVFEVAVVSFGPQMRPARHFNQLASNAKPVARLAQASFDYVVDTKFSAYVL